MRTETTTQTGATFDRMGREDERWLGYGYLGERWNMLTATDPEAPADPELVTAVDAMIVAFAAANGWDYERLFAWANSKNGRWFADAMFGATGTLDERFALAQKWGVLR